MSAGPPVGSTRSMARWRRLAPPLVAGLIAGAVAFVAVGLLTPGEDPSPPADGDQAAPFAQDSVSSGRAVFARMGCGGCHRLAAARSAGGVGPNLDGPLAGHTHESLSSAIVAPSGSGQFGQMPSDYGERLSPDELDDLVTFLLDAREP